MAKMGSEWRVVDGVATAWFEAPSLSAEAEPAARVVEVSPEAAVDVHDVGVRVRLGAGEDAGAVSAAGRSRTTTVWAPTTPRG